MKNNVIFVRKPTGKRLHLSVHLHIIY